MTWSGENKKGQNKTHSSAFCCREPQEVFQSSLRTIAWLTSCSSIWRQWDIRKQWGSITLTKADLVLGLASVQGLGCWPPHGFPSPESVQQSFFCSVGMGRESSAALLRQPDPESSLFPHFVNLCPIWILVRNRELELRVLSTRGQWFGTKGLAQTADKLGGTEGMGVPQTTLDNDQLPPLNSVLLSGILVLSDKQKSLWWGVAGDST